MTREEFAAILTELRCSDDRPDTRPVAQCQHPHDAAPVPATDYWLPSAVLAAAIILASAIRWSVPAASGPCRCRPDPEPERPPRGTVGNPRCGV